LKKPQSHRLFLHGHLPIFQRKNVQATTPIQLHRLNNTVN